MKAFKRILATMMCLCLVWGCVAVIGSAEETPTGSITIENQSGTNASVAGKTLNLFKIFEATTDGENISYQWVEEEKDGQTINKYESFFFGADGVISEEKGTIHDVVAYINGLKDDSFAFSQMAAKLHTYIHAENITADESEVVPDGSTSFTFSNLELGYYLIYDATDLSGAKEAVRSAAMLTHPGENKTIKLKADRPHIVKQVDDDDTDAVDWKLGTTASIGEIVSFRIATMIPNHDLYGDNYTFVISDTMANELKLVDNSIKVVVTEAAKVDDETQNASTTYDAFEIVTEGLGDEVDFKITFNNVTDLSKDTVIEVFYDAEVTVDAKAKNINTATLTYSNDPNTPGSTGSVSAEASVMLWQFTLTKHMEDASGTPSFIRLPGAEFEIYSKTSDGESTRLTKLKFTEQTVQNRDGVDYIKYVLNPEGTVETLKTMDSNGTDDGTTDVGYTDGGNLGQILIWGLGEGTYVIRETKAPAGYQIAKGDFEFTVSDTIGITGAISDASIKETRTDAPGKFTRVLIQENSQKYYIGITNAPGAALPETGGMGTTLFTVIGIVLMAGAIGFFSTRKRNSMA